MVGNLGELKHARENKRKSLGVQMCWKPDVGKERPLETRALLLWGAIDLSRLMLMRLVLVLWKNYKLESLDVYVILGSIQGSHQEET